MARSLVDIKIQLSVYKKYKNDIFQANGRAAACSNKVYSILTKELGGMTPKAIQTSINRHASDILEEIHPVEFVTVPENSDLSSSTQQNNGSECLSLYSDSDIALDHSRSCEQSNGDELIDSFLDESTVSSKSFTNDLISLYQPHVSLSQNVQVELGHELQNIHKSAEKVKKFVDILNQQKCAENRTELLARETAANDEIEKLRSEVSLLGDIKQQQAIAFEQKCADQRSKINCLTGEKTELLARETAAKDEIEKLRSEVSLLGDIKQQQAIAFEQKCADQRYKINCLTGEKTELLARETAAKNEIEKLRSEVSLLGDIKQQAIAFEQKCADQRSKINCLTGEKTELLARETAAKDEIEKLRSEVSLLGDIKQQQAIAFEQKCADQRSKINCLTGEKTELLARETAAKNEIEKLRSEVSLLGDIKQQAIAFEQKCADQRSKINCLTGEKTELLARETAAKDEIEKLRSEVSLLGDKKEKVAIGQQTNVRKRKKNGDHKMNKRITLPRTCKK